MSSEIINVGVTPVELPRGSAASVLVQNQSDRRIVRLAVAASAPAVTAAGPLLPPFGFGRMSDLAGGDKIWAWSIGSVITEVAPVLVEQEA